MHYDFQLAWGISQLSQPRSEEVVEHYLSFLDQSEETIPYAFAWNNVSIAYRELGQCEQAKEAAQNALSVMAFGNAEANKRFAEFCLEMQRMGVLDQASAETTDLAIALSQREPEPEPEPEPERERPETQAREAPVVAAKPVERALREEPVHQNLELLELADEVLAAVSRARGLKVKRPITKVLAKRKDIEARLIREIDALNPPQKLDLEAKLLFKFGLLPRNYDLAGFLRESALSSTASFYDPQTPDFIY